MKTDRDNINEWLRREAHIVAGHAFQMNNRSCLPVWPEKDEEKPAEAPQGFLVTFGSDVTYMDAYTPEGEEMLGTWIKYHMSEMEEKSASLPAECWYG